MATKRRLYEGVFVSTALYGAETQNMREADRRKLNVSGMRMSAGHVECVENVQRGMWM